MCGQFEPLSYLFVGRFTMQEAHSKAASIPGNASNGFYSLFQILFSIVKLHDITSIRLTVVNCIFHLEKLGMLVTPW